MLIKQKSNSELKQFTNRHTFDLRASIALHHHENRPNLYAPVSTITDEEDIPDVADVYHNLMKLDYDKSAYPGKF